MQSLQENLEKSAILMLALGEKEASNVLKLLEPKEVQSVGMQMAQVRGISQERLDQVMIEAVDAITGQSGLGVNSDLYIRNVISGAVGEEKAGFLLDKILVGGDTAGIESLKWIDAASAAEILRDEHPQIIATTLAYLPRDHAAGILGLFSDRLRSEVVLRIATLDGVQPTALRALNETLSKKISAGDKFKKATLGGPKAAAEILNYFGSGEEKSIIDTISNADVELSTAIQEEMFTFEDIVVLDNRELQNCMKAIPQETLIVALKGSDDSVKEKFLANMGSRSADNIREELQFLGPKRLTEVQAAKKEILRVLKLRADAGDLNMSKGGGKDVLV
jgi:flagellar motor switch protein FliG